jgi:hypothetical protein
MRASAMSPLCLLEFWIDRPSASLPRHIAGTDLLLTLPPS